MIEHHEANITGYIFCDIQKTFVGQHFIFIVVFFQETSFQVVLISVFSSGFDFRWPFLICFN